MKLFLKNIYKIRKKKNKSCKEKDLLNSSFLLHIEKVYINEAIFN